MLGWLLRFLGLPQVAFALIAANEPLRTDYRKIVIADRCNPIPAKTKDGKVYFPDGSRVKTGRGPPALDVGDCRELIEEFVHSHQSMYLFGANMEADTFSHLLVEESERQLGDKVGIRYFRAKYGAEHRKGMREANRQLKVMDHDMSTHETFYTPPIELNDALDAPMNEAETETVPVIDVEMEDAAITLLSFCM